MNEMYNKRTDTKVKSIWVPSSRPHSRTGQRALNLVNAEIQASNMLKKQVEQHNEQLKHLHAVLTSLNTYRKKTIEARRDDQRALHENFAKQQRLYRS